MTENEEHGGDVPADADSEFRSELKSLLNRHGRDNGSDTPDWVLADYLAACLDGFDMTVRRRDAAGVLAKAADSVISAAAHAGEVL